MIFPQVVVRLFATPAISCYNGELIDSESRRGSLLSRGIMRSGCFFFCPAQVDYDYTDRLFLLKAPGVEDV